MFGLAAPRDGVTIRKWDIVAQTPIRSAPLDRRSDCQAHEVALAGGPVVSTLGLLRIVLRCGLIALASVMDRRI